MIQSIFAKLMIRFTALILIIIFILSLVLTFFFQDYYLQVKEEEFIRIGKKVSTITGLSAEQGSFYLNAAISLLERSKYLLEEQILIVNREETILAATAGEKWLGAKLELEAISKVLNGRIISFRGKVQQFEEPVLLVAVPIRVGNEVIGAVFVYNTIAGITVIIEKLRQLLFFTGLGVIALAVLISYRFSRSLSRPIQKIGAAAIVMSEGDYDVRLTIEREDEIGQLASNFNILGKKLGDHQRLQREFVANVSHELKTPLTSIRGFVKALRDGVYDEDDSPEEYCNIIMDEVDQMNRLVADLLDLSQIESGISQFKMFAFDLEELTQRTVQRLTPILARGNYRVEIGIPAADKLGLIWGDPDRIGQVLINLIRNAVKHSEPGSTVWIRASRQAEMIRVEVEDEGCGIPAEELGVIWHRFHKVDRARTRCNEEGTGLGLAIVREIIERHGGTVDVGSEVGVGSTFLFTLQAAEEEQGLTEC